MSLYNEKSKEYSIKYAKEKLKRIPLNLRLSDYEQLKTHCQKHGYTVNGFIKAAIREKLDREQ